MKIEGWTLALLFLAPISMAGAAPCLVTTSVRATAPPDRNADPMSGYWHISADRLLWAPAAAPGTVPTGIGRYWVRPAGTQLVFIAQRVDVPGQPIISKERDGYPTGFYFGSVDVPTDGCWHITARTATSSVTFVTEIRYPIEQFAALPATRATWSKEIGRITDGATEIVVTAVTLEHPQSVTRRLRGIRIDITDGVVSDQLWREEVQASVVRRALESWTAGTPPNPYSLGGDYAVTTASGLDIVREKPKYTFKGQQRPGEFSRLLLQAFEELNATAP